MAITDRSQVEEARAALASQRQTLIDKLYVFETASAALADAKRNNADETRELGDAQDAFDRAQGEFQKARHDEGLRIGDLQDRLRDWLPDGTSAEEDVGRLPGTEPIVLCPIRLETRFQGNQLLVRVFPDEIFLNTHETALTVAERDAARQYYEDLNTGTAESTLWRDLVARFGVERSAYLLREMLPVFGSPGSSTTSSSMCGGVLTGGNNQELTFPEDIQLRSSKWTRPGEAILPDRWVVVTYHGTEPGRITLGNRILEPLAMTPDPKLQDADLAVVEGTYKIDNNLRWSLDFQRAVEVGMGIVVDMQGNEPTDGYERIIVVGVKTSMSELDGSRLLEKLIDAHHYTRGVAILRQGTPTNNTEGHPSPYPPQENAGALSFINERQHAPLDRSFSHHCMPGDTNGDALARALGVPSGVMVNFDRAFLADTLDARHMNRALWPGTVGYFMQHMMGSSIFSATQIANAKTYFSRFVLARGPAPAFRIGATPYGVLPVASLRHWAPRSFGDADEASMLAVETGLLKPLRTLLETWVDGVGQVPRIRAGQSNPDLDVATVLSTAPSAREFRVRYGFTAPVQWLFFWFFGWDYNEVVDRLDQETQATLGRIGFPTWRPPIGRTLFYPSQPLFTGDVVTTALSEDDAIPGADGKPGLNFITGIFNATVTELNQGAVGGKPPTPNLLYTMLRHATIVEYARAAAANANFNWVEYFIFNIPSLIGTIQNIIPFLLTVNDLVVKSAAFEHRNALTQLALQTSAELERMFTETLDLVTYRLDAWISAFAYRRLDDMRRAQVSNRLAPAGDFLGGYGWLEDVRPRVHPTEGLPDGTIVERQLGSGGFIHTPSMTHATAAAILRNGNLCFRSENPAAYGIDLSSTRVRNGRWLFEGVRNGQPVGALLGYQLERNLHELHPDVPTLDTLRFTLRRLFPLVANKNGTDGDDPADAIAARNVVDGSLLLRAYKANQLGFGSNGLPAVGTSQYIALVAELAKLDQMYDAAADLLTAESVFQLARGNIDAAVPTMNNVVEGNQPPESIISRSARGGAGLTQRVALVFPSDARPPIPPVGWPALIPTPPRAAAEPVLNAWVAQLVGSPSAVTATVTYLDGAGKPIGNPVTVALDDLRLAPLDVLALADAVAQPNQGSVLDQQIIAAALGGPRPPPVSTPASFSIKYDVTTGRSFPEVLEVLGTAAKVISGGRALGLADLVTPAEIAQALNEPEAEPIGGTNAQEFYGRGQAARTALIGARDALTNVTVAGVRAALAQAARIVPMSAFPDPRVADAALPGTATAVLAELNRRFATLPQPLDPQVVPTRPSAELLDHGKQTIEGVFGPEFRALPDLDPPRAPELHLALQARDTLVAGDDAAPDKYLQQIVRSRDRLGRWRKLNIYARLAPLPRPRVDVVQLPFVPGEKWLGVGFDIPPNFPEQLKNLPEEGRTGVLLLNYATALNALVPWNGLVIDDWIEVIPNQVEETGIALHYESPQAQAPQAILVATPSRGSGNWTFDELLGALEQTVDLMKIRAVSNEYLDVGQTLPMTVIPSNESVSFTVSTIFGSLRVGVDTRGLQD